MKANHRGFTLIELLVVIAIITILAAILFPVFASVRRHAKLVGCLSNLKQISGAFSLYQRDWNDQFPFGLDMADYCTNIWSNYWNPNTPPAQWDEVRTAVTALKERPDRGGMLDQVLKPYTRTTLVWRCPADIGVAFLNLSFSAQNLQSGASSCYGAFHMSYGYRTELTLTHRRVGSLINPAETDILGDAAGYWHSAYSRPVRANASQDVSDSAMWHYNVMFADGHCRTIDQKQMNQYWTWGRQL